ncbi:MAG TPA: type II toxin-antitoxin system RelE/ParE family toxin [Campylobacterales bacterium]|nr:type II toxin-antitoxin system RelE/ParE family toxin [Campylobacterales bacterium]
MSFAVFWTHTAQNDLAGIVEYIYRDSQQNARSVFGFIKAAAQNLDTFPERGRIVPELSDVGVLLYRELIVDRWRLVYRIDERKVFVMMVIDARQDAEDILFRRLVGR